MTLIKTIMKLLLGHMQRQLKSNKSEHNDKYSVLKTFIGLALDKTFISVQQYGQIETKMYQVY